VPGRHKLVEQADILRDNQFRLLGCWFRIEGEADGNSTRQISWNADV